MTWDGKPGVYDGVLYGFDSEVAVWVNERLGGGLVPTLYRAFGVLAEGITELPEPGTLPGKLIAGAYFWGYTNEGGYSDIWVSVAVDDIASARPSVFRKILAFPFAQCGVRRISAEIDTFNTRAIEQAQKLGFKIEGTKRQMGPGGRDVVLLGLLADECPFWQPSKAAA
jgi:RimJ/RimL family protein N-acetyltransferase